MITPIKRLCDWQEPCFIAEKLAETWGEAGLIWLDGDGSSLGRWITIAVDPLNQICCRGLPNELGSSNPFEALRNLEPGHWTGWLNFEAGAWVEPQNPWKSDSMATLWIARHDPILRFDLKEKKLWLEGSNKKRFQQTIDWLNGLPKYSEQNNIKNTLFRQASSFHIPIESWQFCTNKEEYIKQVNLIKDWISCGDIFQANLSTCCTTTLPKGKRAIDIFHRLRQYCPAPFAGVIIASGEASGEAVITSSPERFIKVLSTGEVETRPIKGTRPRHHDPKQDADLAIDLVCSEKDRAENIMIVDLLRNDLGRVCNPGSINVPQLIGLESYSQVHHLTSVINGCLQPNKTWVDVLEACWPGGSISGAPKLRACQRLQELETTSRGPYCGSFLHLNWQGDLDSNILIRSLMLKESTLRANAGCGIVADSDADNEAEELSWKLLPLLKAMV